MDVAQRDIWWADLGEPKGSEAGYQRPVVVLQSDAINQSRLATYICVPVTGSSRRAPIAWNLKLDAASTGLHSDSVAQTTMIVSINRSQLIERIGRISPKQLNQLFACLDIALGRH
jgi:mRNA interferase MazF